MMNYLAALLGIALMGAVTTASVYRADSISWKAKYDARVSQEQTAAQQAKDNAAKQEASDLAQIKANAASAESFATTRQVEAEVAKRAYEQKLAALAKSKPADLPHECANQPLPGDLRP